MQTYEITKGVHSISVLNPNLRVFDIVMKTDYGTTYNSYLVKGDNKTALIENTHSRFFDYYISNVKMLTTLEEIDYIVINHCEPDHTGALQKLIELIPHVTIITSQAGAIYIKNITNNANINIQIAKDNDEIDLGGKTLKFINAPFLHWPDTMFTWCEQDKVLFSCDFLGAHYCEPQVIDTCITYPSAYKEAMKGYYDAIFGPFKPYVLKGLEKISGLDIEFAATSHGPVLSKDGLLGEVMQTYKEWSAPVVKQNKSIPLFYCSAYGNTRLIADAIADGIKSVLNTADVNTYDIIEHDMGMLAGELANSDAFLIGSPTLNKDAVPPVWFLLGHLDAVNMQKRPVALFGSFGWSGEACKNVRSRLSDLKLNVFEKDFKVTFVPSEQDLKNAYIFGAEFAATL